MKVLISLPVYKREWILPHFLQAIEEQSIGLENLGFQFELGPDDDATHQILWDWYKGHPEVIDFDPQVETEVEHRDHLEGTRAWHSKHYFRMVKLRNSLLDRAQFKLDEYDYFFSLDSDILLEDNQTIEKLVSADKPVNSPLLFMQAGNTKYPNAMDWEKVSVREDDLESFRAKRKTNLQPGLNRIKVPMAAVLMKPKVVERHRYQWHRQGEDIGFATQLYFSNTHCFLDTNVYCPHIMHRADLKQYLEEGDNRRLHK